MPEPVGDPHRRCAACRTRRPKTELLRFARVRVPAPGAGEAGDPAEGGWLVEFDPQQRAQGRGAYTCRDERCIQRGFAKGGLVRTLRAPIRQEEAERLSVRAVEYLREHALLGVLLPPVQHPTGTPFSGISPGEES